MLSLMMAASASSFTVPQETHRKLREGLVATFTFLFMALYSPGMGPVPFLFSAELFPLDHRMVGMSLVVSLNFLLGGVFNLVVPLISNESTLLGSFAVASIAAWILVWIFVREPEIQPTDNESRSTALPLDTILQIYKPAHSKHVEFQWKYKTVSFSTMTDFISWLRAPTKNRPYFFNWILDQE